MVSGIVALMLQQNPNLTPDDVKCRLMATARGARNEDGSPGYGILQQGAGLVDAYAAVYATVVGCANRGLDIARDLAGEEHYAGLVRRDADGKVNGLVVHDRESGTSHRVTSRLVVNAGGVWTDEVRHRLGLGGCKVRPSRGIHLILPSTLVPIAVAVSLPSPDDGRPVFLIPHPEGVLLGTTDHFHDADLDDPRPTDEEVGYLLRAAQTAFPGRNVTRDKVLGAFAGLRPILDIHADDPTEASREEDIWVERGVVTVSGGKLTTWRSTAEQAVDEVVSQLPDEVARRVGRCMTKGTPLAGLAPRDLAARLEALPRARFLPALPPIKRVP